MFQFLSVVNGRNTEDDVIGSRRELDRVQIGRSIFQMIGSDGLRLFCGDVHRLIGEIDSLMGSRKAVLTQAPLEFTQSASEGEGAFDGHFVFKISVKEILETVNLRGS